MNKEFKEVFNKKFVILVAVSILFIFIQSEMTSSYEERDHQLNYNSYVMNAEDLGEEVSEKSYQYYLAGCDVYCPEVERSFTYKVVSWIASIGFVIILAFIYCAIVVGIRALRKPKKTDEWRINP